MHQRRNKKGESGSVLLTFTLFLMVLLAFAAVATEGGRWFLVRAELSKSVDAGALAGAKNISNPNVNPVTLAEEFCAENFQNGYLGTPGSGTGTVNFHAEMLGADHVKVDGHASAVAILGKILGFNLVPVASAGVAAMKEVEIMLILDRSGSMQGKPFADLKVAAKSFLDFFVDTQAKDKMGLISFSTAVTVNRPLGTNYVTAMKTAIDAMAANDYTNAEDALDHANGPGGFTNQAGIPQDARVQQFAIFFSDGRPNTFRWAFKRQNVTYDAIVHVNGNCDPGVTYSVVDNLYRPDVATEQALGVRALPTGDGISPGSKCGKTTTRWHLFDTYPVPGHGPTDCSIPGGQLADHVCTMAEDLAIQHAQELKDQGVVVYAIGLGTMINSEFLERVASSPDKVYMAPTSDDLQAIFLRVAQEIKLRLVS